MTTYINFTPSATQAFTFQPTLDGSVYNVTVQWNIFGQRFYLLGKTLGGVTAFNCPMVGSPLRYDINLVAPFGFTSSLVFRAATRQFEISP